MSDYTALIVTPKAPYIEWAKSHAEGIEIDESTFCKEPEIWMIPHADSFESRAQFHEYVEDLKPVLFCALLSHWDADEDCWPDEDFTAALFDEWFEASFNHNVFYEEDLYAEEDDLLDEMDELGEEEGHSALAHAAIMEAVDNQLAEGSPPEVKETFKRLRATGVAECEVRRLIATALVAEMYEMATNDEEFNEERYKSKLSILPETPWLEEEH